MTTKPAREGWFGRTHRTAQLWQVGPSDGLLGRSVRTSSSCAERYQCYPTSSCSISLSTAIPTAHCCSARRRQRRAQLRAEATPCGSTRPAEPHPTGRQRVCGKPQWRLNGSNPTIAAVGGSL